MGAMRFGEVGNSYGIWNGIGYIQYGIPNGFQYEFYGGTDWYGKWNRKGCRMDSGMNAMEYGMV